MNARRQTNTFRNGMNMDNDYSMLDSSQYIYAENVRVGINNNNATGVLQNIEGFFKTSLSSDFYNETIIHADTIRDYAIVFTKINDSENFNVYRLDFSNSGVEIGVKKIISNITLDIPQEDGHYNISTTCRWESSDNVKVYWCDGKNQIRLINLDPAHDSYNSSITPELMDIIPHGVLPPFKIKGIGTGSLKSGKWQYCYQLFNARSTETSLSILSPMVSLSETNTNLNSIKVLGSPSKQNSGKSIRLEAILPSTNRFSRAKIIALYYENNKDVPVITVIDDISVSGSTLYYEDKGGSVVTELTVDEFNALVSYSFSAKVLEAKDNMLFAANITENTWDISDEYDSRAYRCDINGNVVLNSNSGQETITFHIDQVGTYDVPKDHDCISPSVYNQGNYIYTKDSSGNYVLGGAGKNIKYRFLQTDLIEDGSYQTDGGLSKDGFELSSPAVISNGLKLFTVNTSGNREEVGSLPFGSTASRVLNYSNPEVESLVRGYKRSEIYRFAIVFYNDLNLPSPAHWIGDILMPSNTIGEGHEAFTNGVSAYWDGGTASNVAVVTHPLGIEFEVKNIPSGVTGFEIVRCERTILDRTIAMQGVISQVMQMEDKPNALVGMPFMSWAKFHNYFSSQKGYSWSFDTSNYVANNYFLAVSPEISFNREGVEEILNSVNTVSPICGLVSKIEDIRSTGQGQVKILATPQGIKNDGKNIVDIETVIGAKGDGYIRNDYLDLWGGEFYCAVLAKYYHKVDFQRNHIDANIVDAKLSVLTDPFDNDSGFWAKPTTINTKNFYNYMWTYHEMDLDTDENNVLKFGPMGINAIMYSNNINTNIVYVDSDTFVVEKYNRNCVILCDFKQSVTPYGGYSYAVRQNSVYIPTGTYQRIANSNQATVYCFGGDTYIGVFDYAHGMMAFSPEDYNPEDSACKIFSGAYIPLETSVNLSLRGDEFCNSKSFDASTGYSNHFVQNDIVQIGDYYVQNAPLYEYNDAYSAQPRAKQFVSKSIYSIDNLNSDSRVMNSQPKTNNEVTDSWTKFKVANYLDVDNRYGSINNMKLFNNTLFFWQTDAFGTLAVNERSLIQDNNIGSLTLGTGGILARYDYVTTKNGVRRNQLKNVTTSEGSIYWYDTKRNELCGFNGSIQTLSKLKGVQAYLNNDDSFRDNPILVYDKKHNEVLFNIDTEKTLVFSEQINAFTSFYTFTTDNYIEFTDKLYLFNSLQLFKYNSGDELNLFDDKSKISFIRFVVNQDYAQTKTFDNVEYGGDFTYGTNFTDIVFNTKRQTSYVLDNTEVDYREDTYKFCIPRNNIELNEAEELANKSYKDRMKGKYLICNYKYDCNKGNTFKVPYISTAYRYSLI